MRTQLVNIFIIATLSWLILPAKSGAQDNERPLPPLLELVSVNPLNGNTSLTWSPGGSPDVAGYVIYVYTDGAGEAIDTLFNPSATSYTDNKSNADLFSVGYLVAAIDSSDNISPLSNLLSTIYLSSSLDTCSNGIFLEWNKYLDINHDVDLYRIKYSVDNSTQVEAGTVSSTDSLMFFSDIETGREYCFTVEAVINGDRTSISSLSCTPTIMSRPPDWINGDYATIDNNNVHLHFSYDQASELKIFRLEKSDSKNGNYSPLDEIESVSGQIDYIIPGLPLQNVYFRLVVLNNCHQTVKSSNPVSPILLDISRDDYSVMLKWPGFYQWQGGVESYTVFRSIRGSFEENGAVSGSDTTYTDDLASYMLNIESDSICYYVLAKEGPNIHYSGAVSKSSVICFAAPVKIFVPNAFTPGGNGINETFAPVLSFTPVEYHLFIKSRTGITLFETRDYLNVWDGSYRGDKMPEDTYFWFLELKTPTGRRILRQGVVSIINN